MLLYVVAFLEGFSTLAVEILAIRIALPIVGTDILFTSVVLGMIMLALSFGYYYGGVLAEKFEKATLLRLLLYYFIFSAIFYYIVSFRFETGFITFFMEMGVWRLINYILISLILFFTPIFLLAHSIPMLMKIKSDKAYISAGKFLLFSTLGSFLGSISPALLLLPLLGIKITVLIVSVILLVAAALIIIYGKIRIFKSNIKFIIIFVLLALCFDLFGIFLYKSKYKIVYQTETKYQNVTVYQVEYNEQKGYLMSLDGSFSSSINLTGDDSLFEYIQESVKQTKLLRPSKILVIGAAGFTYPQLLSNESYIKQIDVVDLDDQIKDIAEKYFLRTKISGKIKFYPYPARFALNFLIEDQKRYDLIYMDAFEYKTIPSQLLSIEYFRGLKKLGDNVMINLIADYSMESKYAMTIVKTILEVYPHLYYKQIGEKKDICCSNILLSTQKLPEFKEFNLDNKIDFGIYTDDKNLAKWYAYSMFYLN